MRGVGLLGMQSPLCPGQCPTAVPRPGAGRRLLLLFLFLLFLFPFLLAAGTGWGREHPQGARRDGRCPECPCLTATFPATGWVLNVGSPMLGTMWWLQVEVL